MNDRLVIFDWETTGVDIKVCRGVQFAAIEARGAGHTVLANLLCNPTVPIDPKAQKVHGISAEMVANEPLDIHVAASFSSEMDTDGMILCGHNIGSFDTPLTTRLSKMGGFERGLDGHRFIDTYPLAMRLWPDAPSHRLSVDEAEVQGLTQTLGLNSSLAAHDAANDCVMVLAIVRKAQEQLSMNLDELADWLTIPLIQERCLYRKFKGVPWEKVPFWYARWMTNNFDSAPLDLQATIKFHFNLSFRKMPGAL